MGGKRNPVECLPQLSISHDAPAAALVPSEGTGAPTEAAGSTNVALIVVTAVDPVRASNAIRQVSDATTVADTYVRGKFDGPGHRPDTRAG